MKGFSPSQDGNSCQHVPETYFSYANPFAVFICVCSIIGITITGLVTAVFLKYRQTPVVKASSLKTSVVLMLGIIFAFASPMIILAPPSAVTCGLVRFCLGLGYTIGYSAICAKLYMLNSIFNSSLSHSDKKQKVKRDQKMFKRKKKLPRKALLLTLTLIAVHIVFLMSWILLAIPQTENIYSQTGNDVLNTVVCSDALTFSYLAELIWPFVIMVVCNIYVYKLRNLPKGFNEKNSILYCTTVSFILWTVFVPVYAHSTDNKLRVISLAFALLFNGALLLTTLYLLKVYVILFRKDLNTREAVMGGRWSTGNSNTCPSDINETPMDKISD